MKLTTLPILLGLTAIIGGCADVSLVSDIEKMKPSGSAFNQALHSEYSKLARAELDEGDVFDSGVFARRAEAAAKGKDVDPDEIYGRHYTGNNQEMLLDARADLLNMLTSGGTTSNPAAAARAQAMFDCWAQEQEENNQPEDITRCKNGYLAAMKAFEKPKMVAKKDPPPPAPKPAPKPKAPRMVKDFTVYFGFNSADLDGAAAAIISEAAAYVQSSKSIRVQIVGHTDTSGASGYNQALSEKRTKAVDDALVAAGVDSLTIEPASVGESELAEATGDNVKNDKNRRVVITVR